jgi:hypothetical protein
VKHGGVACTPRYVEYLELHAPVSVLLDIGVYDKETEGGKLGLWVCRGVWEEILMGLTKAAGFAILLLSVACSPRVTLEVGLQDAEARAKITEIVEAVGDHEQRITALEKER